MKSFKLQNRALAALLCLVMVGGFVANVFVKDSEQVEAASLPGISELKNSNAEYNILEIVPDASQAAFAWYIGDSEPINEKKLTSAYGSDMENFVSKYQEASNLLQSQNYLLNSTVNGNYSDTILQNLGTVEQNGDTVTGGFVNNEWFHRYVLDWADNEGKAQIKMTVMSPENVSLAHIELADMVIISGGYYYPDTNVSPEVYTSTITLANDVASSIISHAQNGKPVILDRRAYQGIGLESDRVFQETLGKDPRETQSGIYGTVFFFSAMGAGSESGNSVPLAQGGTLGIHGAQEQGYLVTPQFNMAFSSSISGIDGPFGDVLASIRKENTTRMSYQQALLPEEITMARVVQYLISGAGTEAVVESLVTTKDVVKVLSIQPGDASGVASYNSGIHDNFGVAAPTETAQVGLPSNSGSSADQVTWEQLESWTGMSRNQIVVTELSVDEFIRQSDVVGSTYDLVYIGNDISNKSYGVYQESAQFNTNGQTLAASGSQTFFAAMGSTMTKPGYSYTASSNDISQQKYNELLDFVQSGRPVILAPYLCAGLNWNTSATEPSHVSVDQDSNMYKFLAQIAGRSSVMRQDMLIAGPDGQVGTADDSTMIENMVNLVQIPMATIEFATLSSSKPVDYNESTALALSTATGSDGSLEFIFKITNSNEDLTGNFGLDVLLDLDSDGIYETKCNNFNSFSVKRLETGTDGSLVLDGNMAPKVETSVGDNELVQEQYYLVSFAVPAGASGIIPWSLDVTSLSNTAITSTTKSVTYLVSNDESHVSILQIFAEDSANMEESSMMRQLLGMEEGIYNNVNIANAATFTQHSISLKDFNSIAVAEGNIIETVHPGVAEFVKNANAAETGKLAMATAMQAYDLVILSSYEENATLHADTIEVITAHMESGKPILYSDDGIEDQYSAQNPAGGEYFWNTDQFKNYPYSIDLSNKFAVSVGNNYYTNADVSSGENDCKIIVNTIAIVANFSDYVPDVGPDSGSSDDDIISTFINVYADESYTALTLPLAYVDPDGTHASMGSQLGESPINIYFQIKDQFDASECYFEITIKGNDSTSVNFNSPKHDTTYTVNSAVPLNDLYYFEMPAEIRGNEGTIEMVAFINNNSVQQKIAIQTIEVTALDTKGAIDLFETEDYSNDTESSDRNTAGTNNYVNLIPMG